MSMKTKDRGYECSSRIQNLESKIVTVIERQVKDRDEPKG
jgi:hypothetical protein